MFLKALTWQKLGADYHACGSSWPSSDSSSWLRKEPPGCAAPDRPHSETRAEELQVTPEMHEAEPHGSAWTQAFFSPWPAAGCADAEGRPEVTCDQAPQVRSPALSER